MPAPVAPTQLPSAQAAPYYPGYNVQPVGYYPPLPTYAPMNSYWNPMGQVPYYWSPMGGR